MGADFFLIGVKGNTPENAFKSAVENARYRYGHEEGYTGSIAEKDSFVLIDYQKEKNEGETERNFCLRLINGDDPRIEDKWGPAGCIKSIDHPGFFIFFGWASS